MNLIQFLKLVSIVLVAFPSFFVFAHCPLCTAGAGVGALIAKELGLKSLVIGIWLGAFAVALGWWLGNVVMIRALRFNSLVSSSIRSMRQFGLRLRFGSNIRPRPTRISLIETVNPSTGTNLVDKISSCGLKFLLILISFLSIILPLKLYFYETGSFYLYLFGDYGSLFNRTYVYDKFLLGSILGGFILLISPLISKKIIQIRQGKVFPYQGLIITFILLVIISVFFQFKM